MSLINAITTKQTIVGTGLSTVGLTSNEVLTYAELYNTSFLGMTLGGWMFSLSLISISMIVILNAVKIGGMLSLALKHKEVLVEETDKDVPNKKE